MTLPVAPTSSNADRSENDGKQLTWNLGKTLVTGESSKIEVAFRLWNKTAIIGTIVLVVILIGAGAFFFLRKRKEPEEDPQQLAENTIIDVTPSESNNKN